MKHNASDVTDFVIILPLVLPEIVSNYLIEMKMIFSPILRKFVIPNSYVLGLIEKKMVECVQFTNLEKSLPKIPNSTIIVRRHSILMKPKIFGSWPICWIAGKISLFGKCKNLLPVKFPPMRNGKIPFHNIQVFWLLDMCFIIKWGFKFDQHRTLLDAQNQINIIIRKINFNFQYLHYRMSSIIMV